MPYAILFSLMLIALTAFRVGLVVGAPWGKFTFGGTYPGKLPTQLRAVSAAFIAVYALFAFIMLDQAGWFTAMPANVTIIASWAICGLLALTAAGKFFSKSRAERGIMLPAVAPLTALAVFVTLGF